MQILPKNSAESHKNCLIGQLEKRPYWCISRQRKWGVPIPAFYRKDSGEPVVEKETISHLVMQLEKHGSDFWWSLPLKELLPDSMDLTENDVEKGQVLHKCYQFFLFKSHYSNNDCLY